MGPEREHSIDGKTIDLYYVTQLTSILNQVFTPYFFPNRDKVSRLADIIPIGATIYDESRSVSRCDRQADQILQYIALRPDHSP
jgi:hypothetical protein